MIEHVTAVLLRGVFALRGVHNAAGRDAVQLATFEHRLAVAENEIGIAFDEAVGEILPRDYARAVIAITIAAGGE